VEGLLRGFRVAPFAQDELDVTHTFRVRVARPPETRDAGADRGTTPSIDRELPQ
jgi:hypothetical protein